uniref:Uncharacterized protein n=1 Tax=Amphimedon queenslandica TaxID=400682 RepID=A0A1X7V392_AMPQE
MGSCLTFSSPSGPFTLTLALFIFSGPRAIKNSPGVPTVSGPSTAGPYKFGLLSNGIFRPANKSVLVSITAICGSAMTAPSASMGTVYGESA